MRELIWETKAYDELSKEELFEILKVRQDVFVVEQECAYPDIDDADRAAWHICGRRATNGRPLVAYARILKPGLTYEQVSIGRILTSAAARGEGLGLELMRRAMSFIESRFPGQPIKIGAQTHLQRFYQELGFVPASEPYDEDGISHIDMLKH
ncbi:MAG: GNAT family N-acetyltransferase [Arenicella sp.]|nr:GNAT family N-acetyltransferase [Arenicella sp.]